MDSARFAEIAHQRIELGTRQCGIRDRMRSTLHAGGQDERGAERVFSSLDDAIEYRDLLQQQAEVEALKLELARDASEEGLPAECWIKVDPVGEGRGEPLAIKLRETQRPFFEILVDHWGVVEEYAEQAQMSRSRN